MPADNRANGDSKEQKRIKKIIGDFLKEGANRECSECQTKRPSWCSTNLGVFFCLRCSGIHRSLGVHISKVKSATLDQWTQDQADEMCKIGNEKANAYWEYSLPAHQKPKETDATPVLERFIREKYERQRYKRPDGVPAKKAVAPVAEEESVAERRARRQREGKTRTGGATSHGATPVRGTAVTAPPAVAVPPAVVKPPAATNPRSQQSAIVVPKKDIQLMPDFPGDMYETTPSVSEVASSLAKYDIFSAGPGVSAAPSRPPVQPTPQQPSARVNGATEFERSLAEFRPNGSTAAATNTGGFGSFFNDPLAPTPPAPPAAGSGGNALFAGLDGATFAPQPAAGKDIMAMFNAPATGGMSRASSLPAPGAAYGNPMGGMPGAYGAPRPGGVMGGYGAPMGGGGGYGGMGMGVNMGAPPTMGMGSYGAPAGGMYPSLGGAPMHGGMAMNNGMGMPMGGMPGGYGAPMGGMGASNWSAPLGAPAPQTSYISPLGAVGLPASSGSRGATSAAVPYQSASTLNAFNSINPLGGGPSSQPAASRSSSAPSHQSSASYGGNGNFDPFSGMSATAKPLPPAKSATAATFNFF